MNITDIAMAINKKLGKLNINIVADDIRSGFEKPAFFVQLTIITANEGADIITADIHYFPKLKTQLELFKMTDKLNELFSDYCIEVGDENLKIEEIRADYIDNVLQYKFDLTIEHEINLFKDEEHEFMRHLEMEGV